MLVSDITTRYENYGMNITSYPYVLTGDIPSFETQTSDLLMVTGASDNHALASFNCLFSMVLADPYASYLYIDLGITEEERDILFSHFDTIHQIQIKMQSSGFIAYRKFKWSSFPKWMWLKGNPLRQDGYAWKVISYIDAAFKWKGITIWNDGGNIIRKGLSRELTNARVDGVYSPPSTGSQNRWTHRDTSSFLLQHHLIESFNKDGPNGSGGFIVSDWHNTCAINKVLYPLLQCAYTQKCITPRNSNKDNHRQDQAVLSALLNNINPRRAMNWNYDYHPSFRVEFENNTKRYKSVLGSLLRGIQDTYHIKVNSSYISKEEMKYS